MVTFADNFESQDTERASLLLIEDEKPVMELLIRILSNDYKVHTAGDCAEAEEILRELDIEVIICDHGLPGESGLDFLSRIRHDFPYIQRIILTGHRDLDLAIRAINEGDVHRYLPKPADFSTVCEAISTGLEKRKKMLSDQKVAEEHDAMQEEMRSVPYGLRRLCMLSMEGGRFMVKAMSLYFIGSLGFFICGFCLLMALYLIKTVAGVDFLEMNLEDIVGKFHQWAVGLAMR
ncbi:MAG: response regulator [Verrucomicrobiales bacterium]|jgi:ActR/RegA family two-component response regulator